MTYDERDVKLKSLLDKEFLDRLAEVARLHGWSGDYIEIGDFVERLYRMAEIKPPMLEPYEVE